MMEWTKDLKIEELPEQYQEMSRLIGMDNTIILAAYYGKSGVYFPSLDGVITAKKKEYIVKNFKGDNHKALARETDYSERWVYEILEEARRARMRENAQRQRSLF